MTPEKIAKISARILVLKSEFERATGKTGMESLRYAFDAILGAGQMDCLIEDIYRSMRVAK